MHNITGSEIFTISLLQIAIDIPGYILVVIAIVLSAIIWFVGIKYGDKGQMAIYTTLSGMIIVVGYYVYEVFLLKFPEAGAQFEIPFNFAQVFLGTVIAIPVITYLHELGIIDEKIKDIKIPPIINIFIILIVVLIGLVGFFFIFNAEIAAL